jgi:hypothetical protein
MNIAILCDFPFPNGLAATNRIISYSKGLVNFGNTVTVYVYRPTEKKTLIRNPNGVGDFEVFYLNILIITQFVLHRNYYIYLKISLVL